jgi:hypothetical protein
LLGNIPRLRAARTRRELQYRSDVRLTVEQVRQLVLEETEDPDAAEDAAVKYMAAIMRAGETPQ